MRCIYFILTLAILPIVSLVSQDRKPMKVKEYLSLTGIACKSLIA